MKLIDHPFDPALEWHHCKISENSYVRMGIYKVIYGWRVRAGFVHDKWGCTLDWCGGANWTDIEKLYSLCYAILSKRDEENSCFEGLPQVSSIKPFYKDDDFVKIVGEAAGDFELISLERPNLFEVFRPENY